MHGTAKQLCDSRKTPDGDTKESILSAAESSEDKATNLTLSPINDFKVIEQKQHKLNVNTTHYGNMHFRKARRCS